LLGFALKSKRIKISSRTEWLEQLERMTDGRIPTSVTPPQALFIVHPSL